MVEFFNTFLYSHALTNVLLFVAVVKLFHIDKQCNAVRGNTFFLRKD